MATLSTTLSLASIFGLLITWGKMWYDNKNKKSQLYLNQIKAYLQIAADLLLNGKNNNIKWHQAIQLLITVDTLTNQLEIDCHREICVMEYLNAGYKIIDILKQIKDFRFFYGIENYVEKNADLLHLETDEELMKKDITDRISPQLLLTFCGFIDKVTKINDAINTNKTSFIDCFNSEYFKQPIASQHNNISQMTCPNVNIIFEYIKHYNELVSSFSET